MDIAAVVMKRMHLPEADIQVVVRMVDIVAAVALVEVVEGITDHSESMGAVPPHQTLKRRLDYVADSVEVDGFQ